MDPSSPFLNPAVPIELESQPASRRPKVSLSVLLAHIREKRDPMLDVIYNSPAPSVATTCSGRSRRSSRRASNNIMVSRNLSVWSESDSDEDAYADGVPMSAVTCSSISSTNRRSIGGTAVKKRPLQLSNHNTGCSNTTHIVDLDSKGRSCSLGNEIGNSLRKSSLVDPDAVPYRTGSMGALSTKSSRKPSLHLPSDGPPYLNSRRNSSVGAASGNFAMASTRRRSSHRSSLVSDGPSPLDSRVGDVGGDETRVRKKRPRAFQPVSPRDVYLWLYGDEGGGGGGVFDDGASGSGSSLDRGPHGPPSRKSSGQSSRRKSTKRDSNPPQLPPLISIGPLALSDKGSPTGKKSSKRHEKTHRKKSLQSGWFDDEDEGGHSDDDKSNDFGDDADLMELDSLGPLSPALSKRNVTGGARLTPSKRSAENINLFDPFFSFSRRCVTAPIRNIGPLDNWLSADSL